MSKKLLPYVFLVIIGLVDALLNLWVFLLERETRLLLVAAVGILIMIAGIVRIQKVRNAEH